MEIVSIVGVILLCAATLYIAGFFVTLFGITFVDLAQVVIGAITRRPHGAAFILSDAPFFMALAWPYELVRIIGRLFGVRSY
jgi:hypothetical protein